MRYIPTPGHTKLWQERTPLAQYINNEVQGTRMRRWERPIHDFITPYMRGAVQRMTGHVVVPRDTEVRRDLNTLADTLQYLRGLRDSAQGDQVSLSCRKQRASRTRARSIDRPIFGPEGMLAIDASRGSVQSKERPETQWSMNLLKPEPGNLDRKQGNHAPGIATSHPERPRPSWRLHAVRG